MASKLLNMLLISAKNGFYNAFDQLATLKEFKLDDNIFNNPDDYEELLLISASQGNAESFFKLSKIYKNKGNNLLFKQYLKESAELGCIEGIHSLAALYLEEKNYRKAVAWFYFNANNNEYMYSFYNCIKIYIEIEEYRDLNKGNELISKLKHKINDLNYTDKTIFEEIINKFLLINNN